MTFVLGLTGSLGMGKSTTAGFFAEAGVPVHDADACVHRLYAGEAVAPIEAAFPGTTRNGRVDREALGRRVLGDPAALARLESIVHPLVQADRARFVAEAERNNVPIVLLDIPLLFESGGVGEFDAIVVVTAPEEVQRERALARPGMTPEKLASILARQMPDAEKRRRADFIVDTSGGFDTARARVGEILAAVTKMSPRRK